MEIFELTTGTTNNEQWVKFFIQALYQTADDALTACLQLIALREKNRQKIAELGRSAKSARQVYDYIERSPIIDIRKTSNQLKLPFTTVSRAVERLRLLGILQLTETVKRNRCFAYEEYLAILRKDT